MKIAIKTYKSKELVKFVQEVSFKAGIGWNGYTNTFYSPDAGLMVLDTDTKNISWYDSPTDTTTGATAIYDALTQLGQFISAVESSTVKKDIQTALAGKDLFIQVNGGVVLGCQTFTKAEVEQFKAFWDVNKTNTSTVTGSVIVTCSAAYKPLLLSMIREVAKGLGYKPYSTAADYTIAADARTVFRVYDNGVYTLDVVTASHNLDNNLVGTLEALKALRGNTVKIGTRDITVKNGTIRFDDTTLTSADITSLFNQRAQLLGVK